MNNVVEPPAPTLVTNMRSWRDCVSKIGSESRVAIDLEANSLYAYRERICLIQISIQKQDFIVDPLADLELSALGEIIQDPEIEKVFHAAEYDMILLKRQHGWRMVNLFDTMWAARILGHSRYGLANMLNQFYGVKLTKKHQKTNWCRRPLSQAQLSYAQKDTHYLLQLRDDLAAELGQRNRTEEALEIFAEQSIVRMPTTSFDPDDFWKVNGVRKLPDRNRAIAKALFIYRDKQAKKRDQPPFKIFQDRTLLELAAAAPRNRQDLNGIHGMSDGQIRRYGRSFLRVVDNASKDPIPNRPNTRSQRPSEAVQNRYERLRNWRKHRAQKRGVESDVILSRGAMWTIAKANPQSQADLTQLGVLGPWRLRNYSEEILDLI